MFYPKSDLCPFNCDSSEKHEEDKLSLNKESQLNKYDNGDNNLTNQCEMLKQIQEVDFAIIDLNLFLDTHPNCAEALELFTKLSATSKSLKIDYQSKYGPLYVAKSSAQTPFEWVEPCYKWPWEM